MAMADACIWTSSEQNRVHRNPMDIRRLQTIANGANNFPLKKRSPLYNQHGDLPNSEAQRDGEVGGCCTLKQSQKRLNRSVSTPTGVLESLLISMHTFKESVDREGNGIQSSGKRQVDIQKRPTGSRVEPPATPKKLKKKKKNDHLSGEIMAVEKRCPPYGMSSIVGKRKEMEDAVAAVPSFYCARNSESLAAFHFFGVYDGHGGSQASEFCRKRLHHALALELRALPSSHSDDWRRDKEEWEKVMKSCFMKMDIEVGGACPSGNCDINNGYSTCCQNPIAPDNVGSTAVVAVVSPSQIVVANCGDSRAVLYRGGKAIPFSVDHKPERVDEMDRIEGAGGCVVYSNGYRVEGFLGMSRALGDRFLKQYVISEPEVTCSERTEEDEFLILASDGLWDVLSNEYVCQVARKCLSGYRPRGFQGSSTAAAAAVVTRLAITRGSDDNISVVVVDLNTDSRGRNEPSNSE